jgi:hypothetical protein
VVRYFDHRKVAAEAGIAEADLVRLERYRREQYPGDEMLAELHIYRSANSVRRGAVTLAQILSPEFAGLK